MSSPVIPVAVALLLGLALGWVIRRAAKTTAAMPAEDDSLQVALLQAQLAGVQEQLRTCERERDHARTDCGRAHQEIAAATARFEAEQKAAAEKLELVRELETNLKTSFDALAANALDANSQRLADLNRELLKTQQAGAQRELAEKQSAISAMLSPMQKSLDQLALHTRDLEVKREGAYNKVLSEIANIQQSHGELRRETSQLVQTLRAPKARGNWGELQLKRCVEFAGMVEHASFETEKFVRGEDSSVRPDLVVKLPNGRCIVVDAKTPLDAFLQANGCDDEVLRHGFLKSHAEAVRGHLDSLAAKAYWNRFVDSPDFVVCFLPSEVLFSAALEQDPSLLEHSAGKVLLTTPTTLIALLKAVAYGWQQSQIARDAEVIRDVASKVHAKLAGMHANFLSIGEHLHKAGKAYDEALIKAEGRGGLFPLADKLRQLNIGEKELGDSKPVSLSPRRMEHESWGSGGLALVAAAEADDEGGMAGDSASA